MRLNHLDLHVPDVAATTEFFVTCFGLALVQSRGAAGLAILSDGTGLELVLSHPIEKFGGTDQVAGRRVSYHIGFIVADRSAVDAAYARVAAYGAAQLGSPREMRGGWLFYCEAPGHILVEVGARPLHT